MQVPPEGRKLLVLGTTSQGGLMQEMELASAFNVVLTVPMLEEAQIAAVMTSLGAFAPQDVRVLSWLCCTAGAVRCCRCSCCMCRQHVR